MSYLISREIKESIELFEDLSKYIDKSVFEQIFPKWVSDHLYNKWLGYNKNLLTLWISLDNHNRNAICDYLMKKNPDVLKNMSLSHATMRTEDLIPPFVDCLKKFGGMEEFGAIIEYGEEIMQSGDYESDDADYYLNEDLWNALNDIAPEGYYFGAHPGDGSDYGFWECEEEW